MTSLQKCKCGLKFDARVLGAGKNVSCPMCGRALVLHAAAPVPRAGSWSGHPILIAGAMGIVGLAVGTGVTIAAFSGIFGPSRSPSATVADSPSNKPLPPRIYALDEQYPPRSMLPSGDNSLMPIGPIGTNTSYDGPLIAPH